MKLHRLGEDALLARLERYVAEKDTAVIAGLGDDCAVLKGSGKNYVLLKTDAVVAGIHFRPRTPPAAVGRKAMMRPLSDFAAMSGLPRYALVSLSLPRTTEVAWVTSLYEGLATAAKKFDVKIVGGETTSSPKDTVISVHVMGEVEKRRCLQRSGGRAGDDIWVTGRLGGSLRGKHLTFTPRIAESRWLTQKFKLHAMMDVSDGLGADLPRLAVASGCGYELDEARIPRTKGCTISQALNDGEDYELIFTAPPRIREGLERAWRRRWRIPLRRIGRLTAGKTRRNPRMRGYVHFTQP